MHAGRTIFFTSHSLADVEEMCDRMAVLHRGRIRFVGSPAGLRERHGAPTLERAFLACLEDGGMPVRRLTPKPPWKPRTQSSGRIC